MRMRMRRIRTTAGLTLGLVAAVALGCGAVRVLPAVLHLEQGAGTQEVYTLTLINDTDATEDLRVYVGDWQRLEDGSHDWGVPQNGARWVFARAFAGGEELVVRYTVQLPASRELAVEGYLSTGSPQVSVRSDGMDRIAADAPTAAMATADEEIAIARTTASVDENGLATVTLAIRTGAAFDGLTVHETFSERVEIQSVDSGGARFDTINRSNAGWLALSHERLVLEPDESREITVTIDAPERIDGTYWSAVFVESRPEVVEQEGTRVLSIYRTAIKVYVTALGTGELAGAVTGVEVPETSPLAVEATVENTGTVELVVTGEIEVVDRTGETVRELTIGEFKVLPGSARIVVVVDESESEPLPEGIYQAVVSFDYGGDGPVVGVRGFRVR